MKIVEVSDRYINYLKEYFPKTLLDNKQGCRKHTRKYLGVIFKINEFNYFAPLSSPKKSDYLENGEIRKSSVSIIRMTISKKDKKLLLGTIKLNNMIPVPLSEVLEYDIKKEIDLSYRDLVQDEYNWIIRNKMLIYSRALNLYFTKNNETSIVNQSNLKFLQSIIPFKEAEIKCDEFAKILV